MALSCTDVSFSEAPDSVCRTVPSAWSLLSNDSSLSESSSFLPTPPPKPEQQQQQQEQKQASNQLEPWSGCVSVDIIELKEDLLVTSVTIEALRVSSEANDPRRSDWSKTFAATWLLAC